MHTAEPTILLDFAEPDGTPRRRIFTRPTRVLVAWRVPEVRPLLRALEQATRQGQYAVGYIGYEAAPAFDPALTVRSGNSLPLAWFGLFNAPQEEFEEPADHEVPALHWQPQTSRAQYDRQIAQIRAAIAAGTTYQVNYTTRFEAPFAGNDYALYQQLRAAQPTGYGAYLNIGQQRILCLSPELFFERRDGLLTTRPMKGTAPRGRWSEQDDAQAQWLARSAKNRAENLMIVDLLRNDLGRVAEVGSVHVPALFTIERYPTVLQMTSTVRAAERPGTTLEDLFAALFPCGSITGAPKVRTMQLIAELEDTPREVYCGAIGVVEPGGNATFNVAIRTVVVNKITGVATYGVGGGITWDSTAADEYGEVLTKAALLRETRPPFDLLETLRLKRGRYTLLEAHLQRLAASARYFAIPLDLTLVRAELQRLAGSAASHAQPQRVRLRVSRTGAVAVEHTALALLANQPQRVALAHTPIAQHNRFLYHKTTNRALYEQHRQEHPDAFDVLLWNEAGELTEFTIGNLVLQIAGRLYTPPRSSGLLAGVLRNLLLQRGTLTERVLRPADLARAEGLWLINSVRGWVPVKF